MIVLFWKPFGSYTYQEKTKRKNKTSKTAREREKRE
jgi:hypothetical protein